MNSITVYYLRLERYATPPPNSPHPPDSSTIAGHYPVLSTIKSFVLVVLLEGVEQKTQVRSSRGRIAAHLWRF